MKDGEEEEEAEKKWKKNPAALLWTLKTQIGFIEIHDKHGSI